MAGLMPRGAIRLTLPYCAGEPRCLLAKPWWDQWCSFTGYTESPGDGRGVAPATTARRRGVRSVSHFTGNFQPSSSKMRWTFTVTQRKTIRTSAPMFALPSISTIWCTVVVNMPKARIFPLMMGLAVYKVMTFIAPQFLFEIRSAFRTLHRCFFFTRLLTVERPSAGRLDAMSIRIQSRPQPPGKLDNSRLLHPSGALKKKLVLHYHFVTVPTEVSPCLIPVTSKRKEICQPRVMLLESFNGGLSHTQSV